MVCVLWHGIVRATASAPTLRGVDRSWPSLDQYHTLVANLDQCHTLVASLDQCHTLCGVGHSWSSLDQRVQAAELLESWIIIKFTLATGAVP